MVVKCRSLAERLFLELDARCESCREPLAGPGDRQALETDIEDLGGGRERATKKGFCRSCAEPVSRIYEYPTNVALETDHLGGADPSTAISADEFRAIAEHGAKAPEDAPTLSVDDFWRWRPALKRARIALCELGKLGEDVDERLAAIDALRARYGDSELLAERRRQLAEKRAARGKFDNATHEAHRLWLETSGREGERLILVEAAFDMTMGIKSLLNVSKARLTRCFIIGQKLDYSEWVEAELIECRGFYSHIGLAKLMAARLTRCCFTGADFSVSDLREVTIEGGEFREAVLVRCDLSHARLTNVDARGARIGDTPLDSAVFEGCDLRECDFGVVNELFADRNSTTATTFRRCDLRGARFAGRVLEGARFEDCKLHGVRGPATVSDLVVSKADLSPEGDGSIAGAASDVERLLAR